MTSDSACIFASRTHVVIKICHPRIILSRIYILYIPKGNFEVQEYLTFHVEKVLAYQSLIRFLDSYVPQPSHSPVHTLLGNFSATFSLLSNFQCIGQLLSFCVSIVTVMLLLRVKQLKSTEYKNIDCVENVRIYPIL